MFVCGCNGHACCLLYVVCYVLYDTMCVSIIVSVLFRVVCNRLCVVNLFCVDRYLFVKMCCLLCCLLHVVCKWCFDVCGALFCCVIVVVVFVVCGFLCVVVTCSVCDI